MNKEETTEGNKLIAELDPLMLPDKTDDKKESWYRNRDWTHVSVLKYHKSWDWLMPAVRYAKEIGNSANYTAWNTLNYYLMRCEIDGVFSELIKFIKWYNQNKKP